MRRGLESMLIEEFASEYLSTDEISYDDFILWLHNYNDDLEKIYNFCGDGFNESSGITYEKENIAMAENYFLTFQAFLGLFLKKGIDTNRFKRIYREYGNVLHRILSKQINYYGDIYLIINQEHKNKLLKKLIELKNEILCFSNKQTIGSIEYEKFPFAISKSGIGKGINYRIYQAK